MKAQEAGVDIRALEDKHGRTIKSLHFSGNRCDSDFAVFQRNLRRTCAGNYLKIVYEKQYQEEKQSIFHFSQQSLTFALTEDPSCGVESNTCRTPRDWAVRRVGRSNPHEAGATAAAKDKALRLRLLLWCVCVCVCVAILAQALGLSLR